MVVRLVRQSSEFPNITNKDDVKMIRYAYGGYNGVVQGFGQELSCSTRAAKILLNSGRIVLDGWEVDIEETLTLTFDTGYYSVYLEVDAAVESAEIKLIKDLSEYPDIEEGDDLTSTPFGRARLLLYHVRCYSLDSYVTAEKVVTLIPYTAQRLLDLEDKVEKLGFKEGEFSWEGGVPQSSTLYKQANYVIGTCENSYYESPLRGEEQKSYTLSDGTTLTGHLIGKIPLDMLPSVNTYSKNLFKNSAILHGFYGSTLNQLRISSLTVDSINGNCYIKTLNDFNVQYITLKLGYEIKGA